MKEAQEQRRSGYEPEVSSLLSLSVAGWVDVSLISFTVLTKEQ